MRPKLILLEGIPGSGKSTAAEYIQRQLARRGFTVRLWHEGDLDHPADFEAVACLRGSDYRSVCSRYPEQAPLLEAHLTTRGDDYFLPHRKLEMACPGLPADLLAELRRFDVYDGLPAGEYRRLALARWREFVAAAQASGEVTLLECCAMQNPLTVLLARHNLTPDECRRHLLDLAGVLQPLDPLLIYLCPRDVPVTLEHVRRERPKEWADFVTWYLTGQSYGQAHGLHGFEGVIDFYAMRQTLELDILRDLPLRSLVVDNTDRDWERCNAEMMAFLQLWMNVSA
jgi:hypothetical protein